MTDTVEILAGFKPESKFFVGLDSDGCVFDTMEIKHKECFIPMFIKYFELQPISKYARQTWEFVNLYSKTRGINRFPALVRTIKLLSTRQEVKLRKVKLFNTEELESWIATQSRLTNATLEAEIKNGHDNLQIVLDWSIAVNDMIADIVKNVPPFPFCKESILRISESADILVVSQTPTEALNREWKEHNLSGFVKAIAGQEMGSKSDHLRLFTYNKYEPDHVLMIGDAIGDLQAAKENNVLFYPIIPGQEEFSWQRLFNDAINRFFKLEYKGDYEDKIIAEFEKCLPENPLW